MRIFILSIVLLLLTVAATAQTPEKAPRSGQETPIGEVTIYPLFAADFTCAEHWEGQLPYLGDALGSDCQVEGGDINGDTGFLKFYKTNGAANEDWYSWGQDVLAPFDATVFKVNVNPVVNKPGKMGSGPASMVIFKRDDGTMVMIGHLQQIKVKEGDKVKAGQAFAKVGNNGFSRVPHIHIGAWRDETPLQIRFDLRAMGKLRSK